MLFGICFSQLSFHSFFFFFTPPFIDNGNNYNLRIEYKVFVDNNEPTSLDVNVSNDLIYSIEGKQYQFQYLIDYMYGKDKLSIDEGLINIHFKSKEGISKDEFLKILQKEYDIK
ncbi:hypothetical protein QFZ37_001141 [Chryseobacterium ginsenosidimutans]|uniref:hypothetical protein n=1 Tax=Chryseobacterium ginsenosidimutans TaxID=687846 RepID=UPI002782EF98|nr:hypothetical protein [Chryseobacterium ginsenosidimutans]MDQ0592772.1 hypothetical protein [Chryseobacterium ginsenosidimutans]